MGPAGIALYLGLALAYAGAATALFWGVLRLAGRPGPLPAAGLVLCALFVIFLGLHPFPDPAQLDCSAGGRQPRLRPFAYVPEFARLWQAKAPPMAWVRNLTVSSTVMNVVFFALLGALAARLLRSARAAFLLGLGVSLFIEIAQLTALFGLYPCPYRNFDVDDLILNALGVMAGFLVFRRWRRRDPTAG